jgi:hypothetical protein
VALTAADCRSWELSMLCDSVALVQLLPVTLIGLLFCCTNRSAPWQSVLTQAVPDRQCVTAAGM